MRSAPPGKPAIISLILLATAASGLAAVLPAAASPRPPAIAARPAGHRPLAFASRVKPPPLPAGQRYACPVPAKPGQMQCFTVIPAKPAAGVTAPAATTASGYGPADLRSAYKIATAAATKGTGLTVAIVDAFGDPKAASDLAAYRAHYGLPACTTATKCLRIVNEHGAASPLPKADSGWAIEQSLDLDMVSAVCPRCKIVLVQAASTSIIDLGTAENTAVTLGARVISNSWGGGEFFGEQTFDRYFNHAGIAVVFAAGDYGYGTAYPADTQYVTAVGGTLLSKAANARGWTETVWGKYSPPTGTGSGCSIVAAKAAWQQKDNSFPNGCLNRTGNDVAAVASPTHGVAAYDSYSGGCAGWCQGGLGGTSAAAPIIAGIYALAGTPSAGSYPASYPYQHSGSFFDVTAGGNAVVGYGCEASRSYLCQGKVGYDGPTGLGTPNGTAGFSNAGASRVTLLDPGNRVVLGGTAVSIRIKGYDTNLATTKLAYTATGLPGGMSIASAPASRDALITGTVPAGPVSYQITVTGKDASTGKTAQARFLLVGSAPLASVSAPAGSMPMSAGALCLTDPGSLNGQAQVVTCGSAGQSWTYQPGNAPSATGTLTSGNSWCLGEPATIATIPAAATVQTCTGAASQHWVAVGFGLVINAASGLCLGDQGDATATGTPVQVQRCTLVPGQSWSLPAGPVVSGLTGCLTGGGLGAAATVTTCTGGQQDQQWTMRSDGAVSVTTGSGTYCLGDGNSPDSGHAITLETCAGSGGLNIGQFWFSGPNGALVNGWGKCLHFPGGAAALVQQDCYGLGGEVWAIN